MTPRAAGLRLASRAASFIVAIVVAGCVARREPPPAAPPPPSPTPATTATPAPSPAPTATPTPSPTAAASPHAVDDERAPDGPRRHVVLIGDSTTYGTPEKQSAGGGSIQSPYNPGASLEALLALEPAEKDGGTPWRGARVHNLAVGASTTAMWLQNPPAACGTFFELFRIVKTSCARKVAWIDAVPKAAGGAKVDVVIVDLGINDALKSNDPAETVERLTRIRKALAPIPVLFFPPIAPPNGPRGDWPQRVRTAMIEAGLFDEKQYPPYVPTFDGLHPTHGGYAAKAGLWLDRLRALP